MSIGRPERSAGLRGTKRVRMLTFGPKSHAETEAVVQATTGTTDHPQPTFPRLRVAGKFLALGDAKFAIRGVTYGTFRTRENGCDYPEPPVVDRDFAAMAAHGLNSVRVYTVPPRWLLDIALVHGLKVMIGLPWEQHIAYLDQPRLAADIERRVREGVRACAGHAAVLCYAIGNEIPAPVVRWSGRRETETFLKRLYDACKAEDPEALVSYVNYPSTEYLVLPFVDFVCFNVYLEKRDRLEAYLARLQNLAGDRPLVLAELGLDSMRNGTEKQAEVLDWQLRASLGGGCAGVFVFSWTDEWHRGGNDIEDWDFGLVDRSRRAKPALAAVAQAFADGAFVPDAAWPRMSVVVCTYNGSRTIEDCLQGLARQTYANHEIIVVDDGSTDGTGALVERYLPQMPALRLVTIPNGGLSAARNVGMREATGEVLCYTDDDARPDPDWLLHMAAAFHSTAHVAIGGPNIPPPDDGSIAECVANAPGGPIHVLVDDALAEHIPGCNLSVRRAALMAIGGFDPTFRVAGDDVDVCWQLQEAGGTIGFCPAAFVWHHRRNSVVTYWRQQKGYGKAEALLEAKWPEKYNAFGHVTWSGRLYGLRLHEALVRRVGRVYHGVWGSAPFQSLYGPGPTGAWSLATMPEWNLVTGGLALVALLGFEWRAALWVLPLLALSLGVQLTQACLAAAESRFPSATAGWARMRLVLLTAALHLAQPLARLAGRIEYGLSPWRSARWSGFASPLPCTSTLWVEQWAAPEERLDQIRRQLTSARAVVGHGGPTDSWDLAVRAGLIGATRSRLLIEEHGSGRQLIRVQDWPQIPAVTVAMLVGFAAIAPVAVLDGAWATATVTTLLAVALVGRWIYECGKSAAVTRRAVVEASAAWNAIDLGVERPAVPAPVAETVVTPLPERVAADTPLSLPVWLEPEVAAARAASGARAGDRRHSGEIEIPLPLLATDRSTPPQSLPERA